MAEKKFSELTAAAILGNDDIFALSQIDSGSLTSKKTTLTAIANHINTVVQYTNAYGTQAKTTAGAINELKQLISLIPQFSIEVVQELPTEDISDTTIYLVPAEDPEVGNYYEEYIHVNNTWELVGTTAVDLSAYYTKLEVDGLLADKLEADDFEANQTASANPITLETKQAGLAKSCVVTMNPIQSGSGDPSPTNIRPITGRTEASVVRTGNNLISGYEKGGIDTPTGADNSNANACRTEYIKVKPNTDYYLVFDTNLGGTGYPFVYDKNKTFIQALSQVDASRTITIPEGAYYFRIAFFKSGSGWGTTLPDRKDSFNYPSTDTNYHAYTAETHTKEFGQTVYGGSLDLNSGVLTIDKGYIIYNGSENWGVSSGRFLLSKPSDAPSLLDVEGGAVSNLFGYSTSTTTADNEFYIDTNYISVRCDSCENLTAFTTLLTNNNMQVAYNIATPITIQLSPEALTLLKGLNIISTDGDKVQVEFSDIPVGDYSVLLDYIKSLEERIAAVEP